jgi:flagellar biosynthesis protein FlhB
VSEQADRDQRTEPPSPQRLAKAREEGQLPVGRDIGPVAGLAAAVLALVAVGAGLRNSVSSLFGEVAGSLDRTPFTALPGLLARPVGLVLVVAAATAGTAVAVAMAQTRGGVWLHLAGPDLSRLVKGGRLSRLFSKDLFVDLAIALVKVVAIGGVAWAAVSDDFLTLPRVMQAAPADQLSALFSLVLAAARPVLLAAFVIAGLDLAVVHQRFTAKMKMTKEEAKREMKEEEGDPLHRGKRKQRHREISRGQVRREVPRADALVVNPTHIAVAIRYRRDEGRAPRVTAKGKGVLAEHMRELARDHGVPIVEDIPLARLLYRKVKVGREVPAQTFKAVAAILAFVYRVTGRLNGPGARPAAAAREA